MTQTNFLDAATGILRTNMEPLARTSDPVTSTLAAAETLPRLRQLHQRFLEAAGAMERDFTAMEAATVANSMYPSASVESYRKRSAELERLGLIREVAIRCCGITGKPARAFVVGGTP